MGQVGAGQGQHTDAPLRGTRTKEGNGACSYTGFTSTSYRSTNLAGLTSAARGVVARGSNITRGCGKNNANTATGTGTTMRHRQSMATMDRGTGGRSREPNRSGREGTSRPIASHNQIIREGPGQGSKAWTGNRSSHSRIG